MNRGWSPRPNSSRPPPSSLGMATSSAENCPNDETDCGTAQQCPKSSPLDRVGSRQSFAITQFRVRPRQTKQHRRTDQCRDGAEHSGDNLVIHPLTAIGCLIKEAETCLPSALSPRDSELFHRFLSRIVVQQRHNDVARFQAIVCSRYVNEFIANQGGNKASRWQRNVG